MTFLELAEKVLRENQTPLTSDEIWRIATSRGYDIQLNSKGKTPWATLGAQIYVNARDNPKSPFGKTDTRPKRFYLKSLAAQIDLKQATQIDLKIEEITHGEDKLRPKKFEFKERELHELLAYYAFYHLKCYTKTINHSQSTKKDFGQWVHPDMVGCYFPIDDWKSEVYELSSAIGNISIKLYSFELKREVTFGNLRECFFQTVSNSSWANEGYLVATEISKDQEFMEELTRLSSAFGIGVIKLNIDDPHSSEIILPAKYREALDWDTINKLATMNSDVREFISTVKIDVTSKKIHKKEYDPILDINSLRKSLIS